MSVIFLTKDLLFSSRVTSVATHRSIELSVVSDAEALVERASTVPVKVILLDLSTSGLDAAHLVPQLRKLTPPPGAIIAFGPHVHRAKLAAARDAGCGEVFSRGEFNSRMGKILTDYLRGTLG
ncbi:MAG: DNA-binding response OmpR family regulator [Planctomycetaceae bacterium]|jgi:DNA-binding response OmpR family regulator|nr:response regulator transcription factor [Rhodopirellula sp.]